MVSQSGLKGFSGARAARLKTLCSCNVDQPPPSKSHEGGGLAIDKAHGWGIYRVDLSFV
jgi:hypothetical protein